MMMKKMIFFGVFLLSFFFLATPAKASIISIDKNGNIIWKILAYESPLALEIPKQNLEVKNVTNTDSFNREISLTKEDGKVSLKVGENDTLDVTNMGDSLVEIEERGDTKKIEIGIKGDKFSIKEGDILALSSYPINIDPVENRLSVVTPSGKKYLGIFPYEAAQVALRSKYINKINQKTFDITEEERDVSYLIAGDRVINLFNLIKINIPVTTKVSASTGEILSVEQPMWLKVLGFMFS